jgi:hypothetical protein
MIAQGCTMQLVANNRNLDRSAVSSRTTIATNTVLVDRP